MNEIRQFRQNKQIANGITAATNLKMFDIIPGQHENLATNTNEQVKISIAQTFCEPVAVCSTNNPPSGQYTATCVNFPDFAVSFVDSDSVRHSLIGLKLRVVFEHGITYGSVAAGTFPTLSVNGSEALPLLAQGKTMAQGAIVAGQSVEFTIIPYGNSIAFDADSNVRESTNDYTIYTDGLQRIDSVIKNSVDMITSGAVYNNCILREVTANTSLSDMEQALKYLSTKLAADSLVHTAEKNITGQGNGYLVWLLYPGRNYGFIKYQKFNGRTYYVLSIDNGIQTYKALSLW